jgi:hypothetical protein
MSPSMKRLTVSSAHALIDESFAPSCPWSIPWAVATGLAMFRHPSIRAHEGRVWCLAGAGGESMVGGRHLLLSPWYRRHSAHERTPAPEPGVSECAREV